MGHFAGRDATLELVPLYMVTRIGLLCQYATFGETEVLGQNGQGWRQ